MAPIDLLFFVSTSSSSTGYASQPSIGVRKKRILRKSSPAPLSTSLFLGDGGCFKRVPYFVLLFLVLFPSPSRSLSLVRSFSRSLSFSRSFSVLLFSLSSVSFPVSLLFSFSVSFSVCSSSLFSLLFSFFLFVSRFLRLAFLDWSRAFVFILFYASLSLSFVVVFRVLRFILVVCLCVVCTHLIFFVIYFRCSRFYHCDFTITFY